MSTHADSGNLPWSRRLFTPTYRYSEAARFAGTSASNVRRWYHGYSVPGHRMEPVFPAVPDDLLSYMQLVEVAFTSTLRHHGMKLDLLRRAHRYLREMFRVDYPFAQLDLHSDGSDIFTKIFDEPASSDFLAVASRSGQLVWIAAVQERAEQFDYEHGLALRWHPRGRDNVILIDPRISFGIPVIGETGIPTYAIRERYKAGEDLRDIENDFGLSRRQIQEALEFEGIPILAA